MTDDLYQVHIVNVPFKQAQALYRLLVNLNDDSLMAGLPGQTWSGLIPGDHRGAPIQRPEQRVITIQPMTEKP